MDVLNKLKDGLIVSCQALEEEPLHGPMLMAAMARAAALGGAIGIRTNGQQEVDACKRITRRPVIGLWKENDSEGNLCITPTFEHAKALASAGADLVAIDVRKTRPFGEPLEELLPRVRQELGVGVLADLAAVGDALNAVSIGVDAISTTFGFKANPIGIEPDFALLQEVVKLPVPVIAEGGFWYPEQVVKALELGAWAVVVGTAITRPKDITARFVRAIKNERG